MHEIQIFNHEEFGEIRTIEIDGEIYFVGVDVAKALGYTNPRKALKDHVDKEDVTKRYPLLTNGGIQQVNIINESGLYSLVLASKLPGAKKFKRWITAEVLPTIRKTGGYGQIRCIECLERLEEINTNVNSLRTEIVERFAYMDSEKKLTAERKISLSQLKERRIWTNWVFITKNGKRTKKPFSKVNDPASWITFSQAESQTQLKPCGIGVMFAPISGAFSLCGIDIDAHQVDVNPLTKEILELFNGTYIEKSPS